MCFKWTSSFCPSRDDVNPGCCHQVSLTPPVSSPYEGEGAAGGVLGLWSIFRRRRRRGARVSVFNNRLEWMNNWSSTQVVHTLLSDCCLLTFAFYFQELSDWSTTENRPIRQSVGSSIIYLHVQINIKKHFLVRLSISVLHLERNLQCDCTPGTQSGLSVSRPFLSGPFTHVAVKGIYRLRLLRFSRCLLCSPSDWVPILRGESWCSEATRGCLWQIMPSRTVALLKGSKVKDEEHSLQEEDAIR